MTENGQRKTGLFGTYRWVLAAMVAFSHAGNFHHPCGAYAVFSFFILSGYLITLVLMEDYRQRPHGIRSYYMNRALRIYPPYWVGLLLALPVAVLMPVPPLLAEVQMPQTALQWLGNIFIFGAVSPDGMLMDGRLLSISWSLAIEMSFYLLLPLLVLTPVTFTLWAAGSAALLWIYVTGAFDLRFPFRYFSLLGVSPAFALGATFYMLRNKLPRIPHGIGIPLIAVTAVIYCYPYQLFGNSILGPTFYFVFALNGLIVWYLSRLTADRNSRWLRWDQLLGDLSYPLFVVHIPLADMMKGLLGEEVRVYTMSFFLLCFPLANLVAWLVHRYLETPVNALRRRLKAN